MNKSLLMAITACAAMAMTSCSSEDLTSGTTQANETPISFSTYLGRNVESRVGETTSETIKTANFGVFASYTTGDWANTATPNFMFNQKVTYSTDKWTYTPVKYWTNTGKFSFFAYAPYGTTENGIATSSVNTATGEPVLKITVPTDQSKMIDFVAANAMNQTYNTSNAGEVKFVLKHEMTRAAFKATTASGIDASTSVTVTGITLTSKKLYKDATYKFASTADAAGTWTPTELTTDNTITLSNLSLTGDSKSDYLYLIPVSGLTDSDVSVKVNYTVTTKDISVDGGQVETTGTQTVNLPASTLQQGKSYVFTFSIGLNEIKLAAEVNAWATDTNETVTVPAN